MAKYVRKDQCLNRISQESKPANPNFRPLGSNEVETEVPYNMRCTTGNFKATCPNVEAVYNGYADE